MSKNKNKPKSIEEALQARPNPPQEKVSPETSPPQTETAPTEILDSSEILPEQTTDEIVMQALGEAATENPIQNTVEPPQEDEIPQPIPQRTSEQETTTPASNVDLQPVTENSSPEYPPQETQTETVNLDLKTQIENGKSAEEEPELKLLKAQVFGDGFNANSVGYTIGTICSMPRGIPYINTWDIPSDVDVPKLVYEVLSTEGYLDNIWPVLKTVMGNNSANSFWAASVATQIALIDTIRFLAILPYLQEKKNGPEKVGDKK
jgi:hypothetical protein